MAKRKKRKRSSRLRRVLAELVEGLGEAAGEAVHVADDKLRGAAGAANKALQSDGCGGCRGEATRLAGK